MPKVLGDFISSLLSGVMAFLFFDVAYVIALATLILACRGIAQYAIAGLTFVTTFCMSIGASVVVIALLSPLGEYVPKSVLMFVRYGGFVLLVGGFVVNALFAIGMIVSNPAIAAQVKASIQAAKRQSVADNATSELDDQTTQQANELILSKVPYIARRQADKALREFMAEQGFDDAELPVDFFGGVNRD